MPTKRRYLSENKGLLIANICRDMPAGATRRGGLPLTSFVVYVLVALKQKL